MAFFGITDVIFNLEHKEKQEVFTSRIGSVLPTAEDLRTCIGSIARGTALGAILGILPGGGALLASFAAYMFEKKSRGRRARSARATSAAWRRRNRPTMPARRPRSSRC